MIVQPLNMFCHDSWYCEDGHGAHDSKG